MRGLPGWNAQGLPVGTPQRLGDVDDLAHVVARVRDRTMQRFGDRVRLTPDGHGPLEIRVGEVGMAANKTRQPSSHLARSSARVT